LLVAFVLVTAALVAWRLHGDDVERGSRPQPSLQAGPEREAPPRGTMIERGRGGEVAPPPAPPAFATIEGVVTGPNGPLWAVSVVAENSDELAPRVSGGTNTEGRFRLRVEAPGNYTLVVRSPIAGVMTCSGPVTGSCCPVHAGENRFEDAAVGSYRLAAAHKPASPVWVTVKAGETTEVDLPPP